MSTEFRDFANAEVSGLLGRLVTTHSDASLRGVRDALAAAARAIDAAAASPPDIEGPVQALVKQLADAADAATQRVRSEFDKDLSTIRQQAETLREELETESARAATLEADLDAVIEAHRLVDAERVQAESARAEEARARAAADEQLHHVREQLDGSRTEVQRLKESLESEAAQKAVIDAELTTLRSRAVHFEETLRLREDAIRALEATLQEGQDALEAQQAAAESDLATIRGSVAALEERVRSRDEMIRELEARIAEGQGREAALRSQAVEASDAANMLRVEVETLKRKATEGRRKDGSGKGRKDAPEPSRTDERAADMLDVSAQVVDDLTSAATISDLLAGVTRQLATHFTRVALFRVKGNHLEGEHGAGLDATLDVTKLSIPLGVGSVITRAVSKQTFEHASGAELAETPTPLGGQPAAAVAVPILFQGECFAVVYADLDEPLDAPHRSFATLVTKQAGVLLSRLTQELKVLKELRDYAAMLLQEAEQMFGADLDSGRPEEERQRRLEETIVCARQLFAQRAALEGPTAARLLEDQILNAATDPSGSAFAKALSASLSESDVHRTASA